MNWPMISALMTGVLAIAGAANYFMLLSIKLEISRLASDLREWARNTFAEKQHVDSIDRRVTYLEQNGQDS